AFFRYLFRRPGLTVLQTLGIAFGVAAAVGIALSARAAFESFSVAVEFLRGRATHSLTRPAGAMDEAVLAELVRDPAVEAFSPVLERMVALADGSLVRVLGLDPLLDRELRPAFPRLASGRGGGIEDALSFLLEARLILADASLAAKLGKNPGDSISTVRGELRLAGVFPNPTGEPLFLMDIGQAQSLFGLTGKVDRVDLVLGDEPGFLSRWGTGFRLETREDRRATFGQMVRAFRLNLEVLSLLALFVGIFLIYNTAMFSVISRKRDAGILRSLGASRLEITSAFLAEILLLGMAGGALGGILGYGLSLFLTGEVGGAISELYFFLRPAPPSWSGWIPAVGAAVGGAAGVLGSLWPLREMSRLDPAAALSGRVPNRQASRGARRLAAGGSLLIVGSLLSFGLFSGSLTAGIAGAFGFLIGASLLVGLAEVLAYPFIRAFFGKLAGVPGKVAAGNVHWNLSRTAVAVAAFMVALSMSIGLGTMIGSFRHSVGRWLDAQISGDLYISSMDSAGVPLPLYEDLLRLPGVLDVDPYRSVPVSFRGATVFSSGVDAAVLKRRANFRFRQGGAENWDGVREGGAIISESFARRFGVKEGEFVVLDGVRGPEALRVAGIFYDFTSEHGVVMMDRSRYLELWGDPEIDSLGIFLDPDDPRREDVAAEVVRRARDAGLPALVRDDLHANALRVFDATFSVTRPMSSIALVVAFFGIAGALLTLFLERRKEFGVFRALGFDTLRVSA
ncbi:MAG: FtsX-like permease family protein, partial [Candidatus Aminicenantes bacterium]|nr:FtsX-like permease family protein [Candidatus Aminicenantes bacterium]